MFTNTRVCLPDGILFVMKWILVQVLGINFVGTNLGENYCTHCVQKKNTHFCNCAAYFSRHVTNVNVKVAQSLLISNVMICAQIVCLSLEHKPEVASAAVWWQNQWQTGPGDSAIQQCALTTRWHLEYSALHYASCFLVHWVVWLHNPCWFADI